MNEPQLSSIGIESSWHSIKMPDRASFLLHESVDLLPLLPIPINEKTLTFLVTLSGCRPASCGPESAS